MQKVVLIGAYAPSRLGLNEYTYYMVDALIKDPSIQLTVLADEIPERAQGQIQEPQGFKVVRCWKYNSWLNVFRILKEIRRIKPDVVFFNLLFTSFGDKKIPAALGLLTPVLSSLFGFHTLVLLHHLIEFMSFEATKFKKLSRLDRIAVHFLTQMIFYADVVLLPLHKYIRLARKKYAVKAVDKWPHGFYDVHEEIVPANLKNKNILVFGKFGSYKTLDFALAVFEKIKKKIPDARLVIGGRSHPSCPNYVENLREDCKYQDDIVFTGYVPEESLPELFRSSRVVFLPYTATTGVSGVAHWACCYGLPIVGAGLRDLNTMCREEGIVIKSYTPEDVDSAADILSQILANDEFAEALGAQNYMAAQKMPIIKIMERVKERYFKKNSPDFAAPMFKRRPQLIDAQS